MATKIEWATRVWNPVTGCTKGCSFCYARRFAERMKSNPNPKIAQKYRNGFKPTVHFNVFFESASWRKPERVFVGSMGDLFDPEFGRPPFWNLMFEMQKYIQHTYMLLTKQPKNMLQYAKRWCEFNKIKQLPSNIWCGVSVSNQNEANNLIPILLEVPAAVRFVSIEPMTDPVTLINLGDDEYHNFLTGEFICTGQNEPVSTGCLDWVIVGGMTGPGSRPMHPQWVRSIKDECLATNTPFFFKSWGEYACVNVSLEGADIYETPKNWKTLWKNSAGDVFELIDEDGDFLSAGDDPEKYQPVKRIGRKKAGHLLDGIEYRQFPETKK